MAGGLMMAEPKRGRGRPKGEGRMPTALAVKGSAEWRDWVNALASHCRIDAAKLVDLALTSYAEEAGFKLPPPKR